MDKPNFIKSLSPAQQRALAWWFYSTLSMISILIMGIVIVQTKRLIMLYDAQQTYLTLKQETHDFDALVKQQRTLKEDINTINNKVEQIKKIAQTNKQIVELLTLVKKHIDPVSLEKIGVHKTEFTITFKTDQIQTLEPLIQTINQSKSLKTVHLDSIQQTPDNIFLVTLKGRF